MKKLTFDEFAAEYEKTQACIPVRLKETLLSQKDKYQPTGWFMAECKDLSSSYGGSRIIVPYGGQDNTFKEIPEKLFSPRGLASDMSLAIFYLLAEDLK